LSIVKYVSDVPVVFVTISLKALKALRTGTVMVLSRLAVQVGRSDKSSSEVQEDPSFDPANTSDFGARVGLP
jgi:hypothetical protein